MNKPISLCWWLVGHSVAIDLHDGAGNLVRPTEHDEPAMFALDPSKDLMSQAREQAFVVAGQYKISRNEIYFDIDSTIQFADRHLQMTPDATLLRIQQLLDGQIWTPDTLDEIAQILISAGYRVRDKNDVDLKCEER